jgi:hypothetical protein
LNYLHEPYWALRGEMMKKEAERNRSVVDEEREHFEICFNILTMG